MIKLQGKGICAGVAIGKLKFQEKDEHETKFYFVDDVEKEIKRFMDVRDVAIAYVDVLVKETEKEEKTNNKLLLGIYKMAIRELDYRRDVQNCIREKKVCAEYAIDQVTRKYASLFADMDDRYMKIRAKDMLDASRLMRSILSGREIPIVECSEACILAGDDFTPMQTTKLSRDKILALAAKKGTENSHTAIFAKMLCIPAVIDLGDELKKAYDGKMVILDGFTGEIFIDPDDETKKMMAKREKEYEQERLKLDKYRNKKTINKSGREIKLFANIGRVEDVDLAVAHNAEGIGLFRSEFLYLQNQDFPSEELQYESYSAVASKLNGNPVAIRTLDIGSDKQADYFNLPRERNPALGMRAIRICLTRPEIFKIQLRALYRASVHGNIHIMLPMITSVWEVLEAKKIIKEVQDELREKGIPFNENTPIGIMIETTAAAIISDLLAKEVDFFSIGTNDLIQYTLAVDRQNENLKQFCDIYHEAILRLIELVCVNAHKEGIWVGVCGELASNISYTEFFSKIGIDELSVSPSDILPIRRKISKVD